MIAIHNQKTCLVLLGKATNMLLSDVVSGKYDVSFGEVSIESIEARARYISALKTIVFVAETLYGASDDLVHEWLIHVGANIRIDELFYAIGVERYNISPKAYTGVTERLS